MTYRPSFRANAISVPSGDHTGWAPGGPDSPPVASRERPVPSTFATMTYEGAPANASASNRILVPSGDHAGNRYQPTVEGTAKPSSGAPRQSRFARSAQTRRRPEGKVYEAAPRNGGWPRSHLYLPRQGVRASIGPGDG